MAVTSSSGTRLYIGGVRAAATDTVVEYEALTWVEVNEVQNAGEIGDQSRLITFNSLKDSRERQFKGSRSAGTMNVVCGRDPADAGQQALDAAEQTKFEYAFKLELADAPATDYTNTKQYFGALVTSRRVSGLQNDSVTMRNYALAVNTAVLEDTSGFVT